MTKQTELIRLICEKNIFSSSYKEYEIIETHISWIILTGNYAYKIKKQSNLGFYDGSDISKRIKLCEEELRLNTRLTPELYIGIYLIQGSINDLKIVPYKSNEIVNNKDEAKEVVLKMHKFDNKRLLSEILDKDIVTVKNFKELAAKLAIFHLSSKNNNLRKQLHYGENNIDPVTENLTILKTIVTSEANKKILQNHENWVLQENRKYTEIIRERNSRNIIRECHGDLHSENIYLDNKNKLRIFDALEFNSSLRWIDPISEIAFLTSDLEARGQTNFATIFLNTWLESSGDYLGLNLWRWYASYRAIVRAKVTSLRLKQLSKKRNKQKIKILNRKLTSYLLQAKSIQDRISRVLIIMHGLSGSGKSYISNLICEQRRFIRIRSDSERIRITRSTDSLRTKEQVLYSLSNMENLPKEIQNIYSRDVSEWLFNYWLPKLARASLESGYNTIIDATFLRYNERKLMRDLAERGGVKFVIISCKCTEGLAFTRLKNRSNDDVSEATYETRSKQREWLEPIREEELERTINVDREPVLNEIVSRLDKLIN